MRDKILIFSVAGFIIFFLGFIAHLQYFQTKDNVIKLYSDKQITLALQAATSLQSYIKERIKALEIIAKMPASVTFDQTFYRNEFVQTYEVVQGFQHIFYVDHEGVAIFGYPEGYPCPADQPEDIQQRFKKTYDEAVHLKKTLIFEKNILIDRKVTVCLVTPIYSDNNEFIGAIIGALDVRKALYDALRPIMILDKDHAWVINELGYLIYHMHHDEMLIQNLFNANPECFDCHVNFDMERAMFSRQNGAGIKENFKTQKQLIGYAQVELENTRWVVAISTPFDIITTSLRKEFRNFLLMIIVIIVTVVIGAFLVNRINTEHITTKNELENLKIQAALINEKNAAEFRYRILVEQSPDPIFLCTRKKILMVNNSFEKLFGYKQDEVCGSGFLFMELVDPESTEKFEQTVEQFIRNREPITSVTLQMRNKEGNPLDVEISLGRFFLGKKVVYQGIVHDITKVRKLEQEREQRKHLAILGEMAARIAHEIKNPLASIQTGIQLLESQVQESGQQTSYYERLRGEIQRVDKILKGLLTYAREDYLELKRVKIEQVIKRFQEIFQPTVRKEKNKLHVKVEENLPELRVDEHKLEQVLWNLCLNAVQASNSGDPICINVLRQDNGIKITIRDQGVGIPQESLEKIFQPFFSTRSHGSGLGLAISKKIIELHKGELTLESELDKGTAVMIYLPGC
ncbi:MAG: PAS domain S-box protein [bacterium]|nr:MAG: PAS domain S-box protein [bacterium]